MARDVAAAMIAVQGVENVQEPVEILGVVDVAAATVAPVKGVGMGQRTGTKSWIVGKKMLFYKVTPAY